MKGVIVPGRVVDSRDRGCPAKVKQQNKTEKGWQRMQIKSDTVLGCIEERWGYKSGNTAWYNQQVGWVC